MSNRYIFSSESVGEGHPDKVADTISDAVLDAGISSKRLSHDEVLEVGKASQAKLAKLLGEFLGLL